MSRQRFLKEQFELLAFFEEQTAREKRLEGIINQNVQFMNQCSLTMEKMNNILRKLMGDGEGEGTRAEA